MTVIKYINSSDANFCVVLMKNTFFPRELALGKYLDGNKLKYELSFCCHGFLLHWYMQLQLGSKVEKQNHNPDHVGAWNILLSWHSLSVYPSSALASCHSLYKQIVLTQSPRPGMALGPWEEGRRKRILLRSISTLSCAFPSVTILQHNPHQNYITLLQPPCDEAKSKVVELETKG